MLAVVDIQVAGRTGRGRRRKEAGTVFTNHNFIKSDWENKNLIALLL